MDILENRVTPKATELKMRLLIACFFAVLSMNLNARAGLPDFTDLVQDNKPAVVNISTTRKPSKARQLLPKEFELPEGAENGPLGEFLRRFFGDSAPGERDGWSQREAQSLGSGFIISADGYVVTNHHVIKDADEILVRLDDRSELIAELIGSDPRSDIALLKLKAKNLPQVKFGSASELEVAEWVLAIGSPFGFDHSVTAGIVSAKGRSLPNENYVPFIQTDVAINPGNSGGPLFNLDGEVVGVNSQIYSRTGGFMGLSFAIPIELVLDVVDQLKAKGKVSRGWLGVLIQEVTRELAESFELDKPQGALVSKVLPGSPAEKGGIKTGDVILEFNGETVERSGELPPLVGRIKAGQTTGVKILRQGRQRTLNIRIGDLPEPEKLADSSREPSGSSPQQNSRLGLTLDELDQQVRNQLSIDSGGVIVVDVKAGPAVAAGIRRGDVITSLNNSPVKGVQDFLTKLDKLKQGSSVAMLVQRASGPLYLAMRIPNDE